MRMSPEIESRHDQSDVNCISASGSSSFHHTHTILRVVFSVILIAYIMSYAVLRNRGMKELAQWDSEGILYDSVEHILETADLSTHYFRSTLYWPLNEFDQVLFGGPAPILGIMFEIS